ncbi:MAG: sporulation protein YqfD [Clostridia bacterium]|nr:sporulation protein YqfD [Clostridia bacterium]
MFILKIVRWIVGVITISVEGAFPERFLNIASCEGLKLWDVRRNGAQGFFACARAGDFKRIKNVARRASCRVRIRKKTGLRFIMFRHRKRKAFMVSAAAFFVLVCFMSTLLWGVELECGDFTDRAALLSDLSDAGLRAGVSRARLDIPRIRNIILTEHDEIAWIGINIKGTRAYVKAEPRTLPPELADKSEACNIVSDFDAVIESIEVYEGQTAVSRGEAVTRGQMLVSGVIDLGEGGFQFVHSEAEIYGRVWIDVHESVPLYGMKRVYTGESLTKRAVKTAGVKINLFLNSSIPYDKYDKIIQESVIKIGAFELPATLLTARIREYREETYPLSQNEAKNTLKLKCFLKLRTLYPEAAVMGRNIEFTKTADSYIMDAEYECVMPIAVSIKVMRDEISEE